MNEVLGTRFGVMQAPIGGAAGHDLYRAVAGAGGLRRDPGLVDGARRAAS